jgi:hypothetical protein
LADDRLRIILGQVFTDYPMKKVIIATLLAGFVMFIWNFLSWVVLPVHHDSFKYTPKQDSLLTALGNGIEEDGYYYLPTVDRSKPGANEAEAKLMEEMPGKPWAMVMYGRQFPSMNPLQFIKGILYYLIMAFLGAVILMVGSEKLTSFFQRLWVIMLIPIIIVLDTSLESMNWMYIPWHFEKGNIIDAFVSWGLAGTVLAAIVKKG